MKFIPDIDIKWLRARTERVGKCMVWCRNGVRNNCPQARFAQPGTDERAMWNLRRLIWCITREVPPESIEGLVIRATCEEKLCLCPDHLEATTRTVAATESNRRTARDPVRRMKIAAFKRAEKSELTEEMVAEIRCSPLSLSQLCKVYPGSRSAMGKIKRGESWIDYRNPLSAARMEQAA
jgi:hypothetical protein